MVLKSKTLSSIDVRQASRIDQHGPVLNIMVPLLFHILFGHTDVIIPEMKRDERQIEEEEEDGETTSC